MSQSQTLKPTRIEAQTRSRVSSRPSIDATYFCPDLSDELEETSPKAQAGGSFSDVYKYRDRRADPPVFYAIKAFRYNCYNDIDKQKAEKVIHCIPYKLLKS